MSAEAARTHFEVLVDHACAALHGAEVLVARISGEDSDFIRFNHAAIRQAGSVRQRHLSIDLIEGTRHAAGTITLTGDTALDQGLVADLVRELRELRSHMPDDPHLLYSTGDHTTERIIEGSLPTADDALDRIVTGAAGNDLVGIYAAGDIFSGFANSFGQRNWFAASTFNLDWSLHLEADKATKNLYAGSRWDDAALANRMARSVKELDALSRSPVDLAPGGHRAFLAPAAVREVLDMMAWDGFGLRAHRTRRTPLLRMVTDGARLHRDVRISEDIAGGVAPGFQSAGFSRPDETVLIDGGRYAESLVSPRSAMEYGVENNGAEDWEAPVSLSMAAGDLPIDDALDALGTGIFVGNLWYLNFSDRASCRMTGMTRFATFWVEDGEIVAPIAVLRFDDTVYDLLGDRLERLTDEAETMLDSSTYGHRSTGSWRVPGALVDEMTFTL